MSDPSSEDEVLSPSQGSRLCTNGCVITSHYLEKGIPCMYYGP